MLVANHTASHCCFESSYQIRTCVPKRPIRVLGSKMWRHWYERSAGSCGTTAGGRMFFRKRSCPLVPVERNYPANYRESLSCKLTVLHICQLCTEIQRVVYWDADSCVLRYRQLYTEIQTVVYWDADSCVLRCRKLCAECVRLVSAAVRPFHAQCIWLKIFPFD